jgi:hypothetical protein
MLGKAIELHSVYVLLIIGIITAMAEVKEITTLNTVATVRKAAQESMRPVIEE